MEVQQEKNEYEWVETLKKGLRSTIIRAKKDNKEYAVRAIKDLHDHVNAARAAREISLLRNFRHANIIEIVDILVDSETDIKKVYIVMPLMDFTLHEFIEQKEWRIENHNYYIRHVMSQMLKGLDYLHRYKIIHRDLTPRNIMMTKDYDLKIIDFEVARDLLGNDSFFIPNSKPSHCAPYPQVSLHGAPERSLRLDYYDSKVDMWSAGAIFAELIHGYIFPPADVAILWDICGVKTYEEHRLIISKNTEDIPAPLQIQFSKTWSGRNFLAQRANSLHIAQLKFPPPLLNDDKKEAHSDILKSEVYTTSQLRRNSVGIWPSALNTRFKNLLGNMF